jgi:hypothetical protein
MASLIYDSYMSDLVSGAITPSSNTFYVMLVTSAYTPNKSTNTRRSNVTNEVVATGYTSGGAVGVQTLALDTVLNKQTISFADVIWTITGSLTARAGVIYRSLGGLASADPLVAYVDFGADVTCSNSTFTFHMTSGLITQN